jgi:glutamate dehydrogenase
VSLAEEETEAGHARPEDRLLELIDERVDPQRAPVLRAFARAYLRRLAADVSEGISAEDLLAEVTGLFEFASARGDEPLAVRAFNPTREDDGYEPLGSVVETNTDDLPFLVDSVTAELEARGLKVSRLLHPIVAVERDGSGATRSVRDPRGAPHRESVMHFDLDRRLEPGQLQELERCVREVLGAVRACVRDFPAMTERLATMPKLARAGARRYSTDEVEEVVDFLAWLQRGEFVFLGARDYDFADGVVRVVPGSGLGILADESRSTFARKGGVPLSELP